MDIIFGFDRIGVDVMHAACTLFRLRPFGGKHTTVIGSVHFPSVKAPLLHLHAFAQTNLTMVTMQLLGRSDKIVANERAMVQRMCEGKTLADITSDMLQLTDTEDEEEEYLDAVIECECGLTSTRSHFARHKRTQRQKDRMGASDE